MVALSLHLRRVRDVGALVRGSPAKRDRVPAGSTSVIASPAMSGCQHQPAIFTRQRPASIILCLHAPGSLLPGVPSRCAPVLVICSPHERRSHRGYEMMATSCFDRTDWRTRTKPAV
jgi:hypothetical protein